MYDLRNSELFEIFKITQISLKLVQNAIKPKSNTIGYSEPGAYAETFLFFIKIIQVIIMFGADSIAGIPPAKLHCHLPAYQLMG